MCSPKRQRILRAATFASFTVTGFMLFSGCYSAWTSMRYRDLETTTEVSESIFLEVKTDLPPTVFVSESSSAGQTVAVAPSIERYLTVSGYTLVDRPDDATYVLQINHLSLVELELIGDQSLDDAINSAVSAGTVGSFGALVAGGNDREIAAVGLAFGLVGFAVDASTKHLAHTLTTDIRISEMVLGPAGEPELRVHEAQVVSGAAKVNLDWKESLPALTGGVTLAVSGMLPEPNTGVIASRTRR